MLVVYDDNNRVIGTIHNPTTAVRERMKKTGQKHFETDQTTRTDNKYVEFDEKGHPRLATQRQSNARLNRDVYLVGDKIVLEGVTPATRITVESKTDLVFTANPTGSTYSFSLGLPGLYRITCEELRTQQRRFTVRVYGE